ncbi:MAG: tRNA (N6-isopentenyl adenosine(37)-C2)-methylthiotransferase MiaB [Clostridia bacterium]|nr:tRNA (N6-isopentenyl adenosine(37)-C2)-methylthiotransferase MiaB [Clostridia bacterium]MBQ4157557.1 tRNA (N6-isopentenyl adenosine(37)-C2)-methylthiotransferase MiaB [Clostridia bacterium]
MNREAIHVSEEKLIEQKAYMAKVKETLTSNKTYHIVTLGCQMNVRDSETLSGMLEEMGFTAANTREEADLILYNTCCVRENAENKALGNVIWLKELKKDKPELIIAVGGCMMQEEGMADKLIRQYPFIDLIFGTHNAYRFPEYLYRVLSDRQQFAEVFNIDGEIAEGLPVKRQSPYFGFVNVMYGCNNFCSYCIVPYVRGRERSRSVEDVLDECKRLRDQGVQEIMLLGQNVNSYMGGGANFAELLYRVNALEIPRIRFMTSHPKDLSDELIYAYKELEHLMPNLHLPVQAGNNEILEKMNRRYSRERYLELVMKLRAVCPDIGLTSDIIVGFPGETLAQFEDTMSLVKEVRYDAAYTFIYSPRQGTKAALMPDPFTIQEKTERIQRLIDLQQAISYETLLSLVGNTEEVLVDSVSLRNENAVGGKTRRGHMVNFEGNMNLIGKTVSVKITSAGKNTLRGELI